MVFYRVIEYKVICGLRFTYLFIRFIYIFYLDLFIKGILVFNIDFEKWYFNGFGDENEYFRILLNFV